MATREENMFKKLQERIAEDKRPAVTEKDILDGKLDERMKFILERQREFEKQLAKEKGIE